MPIPRRGTLENDLEKKTYPASAEENPRKKFDVVMVADYDRDGKEGVHI
jgi:hypothetical protein